MYIAGGGYSTAYRTSLGRLVSSTGALIAKYTYDVWGNVLSVTNATGTEITASTHIANLQPFRYRSYYLDKESNFYYLQSRYYDPVTHRFINADGILDENNVLGCNLYAYCANNPVMRSDSTGQWFGWDDVVAGIVGAAVGVGSQFISDVVTSATSGSWQLSNWQTYVGAASGGAIGGITTLYGGPVAGAAVSSGTSTLIGQTLERYTGGQQRCDAEIIANTMESTIIGAVVGKTVPTVKVSGVTAGRNSMGAVYKSGLTKLINKTASKMSPKVVGKGIVSETVKDSGCSAVMGLLTSIDNLCKSYFK